MRKTSLVHAKSHLSELVDAAEHHGAKVLILKRGVPAAAIVPVEVAQAARVRTRRHRRLTRKAFDALLDRMAAAPSPAESIDAALGRDRLDESH